MEVCFACHGVQHGPQGELATSECRKCHTRRSISCPPITSPQRDSPASRTPDAARRTGVNRCMMCHTASKDCNACHVQKNVKIAAAARRVRLGHRASAPSRPSVKIYPDRADEHGAVPVLPSRPRQHPPGPTDLRARGAPAARLQVRGRAIRSSATRPTAPRSRTCSRAIAATGCEHQGQGQIATDDCNKCHPPGFKLMPENHTHEVHRAVTTRPGQRDRSVVLRDVPQDGVLRRLPPRPRHRPATLPRARSSRPHTARRRGRRSTASSSSPSRATAAPATTTRRVGDATRRPCRTRPTGLRTTSPSPG